MDAALRNQLILQHIFSYLPFRNLKQCRFVCKDWNREIQSFIRIFRRCDAKISGHKPCSDLRTLNELLCQMTASTINSLTINDEFISSPHSNCDSQQNEVQTYNEILNKLRLRYLDIYLDGDNLCKEFKTCPSIQFSISLLRKNLTHLRTLSLDLVNVPPKVLNTCFGQDWTPTLLPHLKVLEAGEVDGWKDMFLKILNAAPNLKELFVDGETEVMDIVPKEKYHLMTNCYLCMDSAQHQTQCLELALAVPPLSQLITHAPVESGREYHQNYFDVLRALLHSSCKTLERLEMRYIIFPLNQLSFPALVKLKELSILTEATTEQTIRVLGSIDYPTMLPNLETVKVTALDFSETQYVNPWENDAAQSQNYRSSTTVKNLELEFEMDESIVETCGKIFTNVSHLSLSEMAGVLEEIRYADLWAQWSQVEFMKIKKSDIVLGANFDAEFLGINQEEVYLLELMDDTSLELINIVPIRPSVLTMPRLESLRIVFKRPIDIISEEYLDPDQVFLSKLTGILAFRKLGSMGVDIEVKIQDKFIRYLDHLRPFARLAIGH